MMSLWNAVSNPRNVVLFVLVFVAVVGVLLKYQAWFRARRALARLDEPGLDPKAVLDLAKHGREGLPALFELQANASQSESIRQAASQALAVLWAKEELVVEEEQAILRRGFEVRWKARKRYPRDCQHPIPIRVSYGVPFLGCADSAQKDAFRQDQLEWSHRVLGTQRASLEKFSPWQPGPIDLVFELHPTDFAGNAPHRLVLETKARTRDWTSSWELAVPHMPHSLEFDPWLKIDALLALPDDQRRRTLADALSWVGVDDEPTDSASAIFMPLNSIWAMKNPPSLKIQTPLPCDLAHHLTIEFDLEGSPQVQAGQVVVQADAPVFQAPLHWEGAVLNDGLIKGAGELRIRAVLTPNPELGWSDPNIRSIWPDPLVSDWVQVRVTRL